jgi:predicted GNAT family acetyltransferase
VIQIYSNTADGRQVFTVQGNALDEEKIKVKHTKVKVKK